MNIINNNPYRQLGVYTTSSQKDVVSNQGKMKAFLKVNRPVSFSLDLVGILPAIERSEQSVANASAKLALPAEQLKYAQFWFAKCTQIDEIAFSKLTNGDIDGAMDVWSKKTTVSSLQNLVVCSLIKAKVGNAISYASTIYSSYGSDFVKMVLGENALATSENLAHDFLDCLCEEFSVDEILGAITNADWKTYVSSKSTKPLIDKISTAIETSKVSKGKGAAARLNAGNKLMNDTKADIEQLRHFVSTKNLQYQMIADKLGLAILQCGIDFYNDSDAPDAARKAMVLQKYAQSIVVGKMAKDRCRENVDILNKIIAELPPSEVFAEDRAIKEELRKFTRLPDKISYSMDLLNNTKPHLQAIKSKLGSSNGYYLKISTQVVGNALHNVIEEVNALQNDPTFQMNMILDRSAALSSLRSVLRSAWQATKLMDSFDMESDFKSRRYDENRRTLSNMCSQVGVSTYTSSSSSSSYRPTPRPASTYTPTSSSNSSDDTNWGCIIAIIIAIIIFCIAQCN